MPRLTPSGDTGSAALAIVALLALDPFGNVAAGVSPLIAAILTVPVGIVVILQVTTIPS